LTARCRDGEIRVAIHVPVYDNVTQYISALAFLEDRGPADVHVSSIGT
jgi:hypothetical protein